MKKILCILPVLAVLISSCSHKNELTGTLPTSDYDGKQVYLLTMKDFDSPFDPADSTVIANASFRFDLKDSQPEGVAYIVIKDASPEIPNGIPFVYEKGKIKIEIDSVARVTGTPLNDKSQAFYDKLQVVSKKAEGIGEKISQTLDETERQQYLADFASINTEASGIIFDFVKENMKNKVGEFYFIHFSEAFDENQTKELLAGASSEYRTRIESMMGQAEGGMPSTFVGRDFIDVSGLTPDGKNISLSDYVGKKKLVLIDFWASWCGPCRHEMPNVVQAYNKYKDKGFEIVGISLDDSKSSWVKGLKDMNMTWPQMSDLKGWESELSGAYQVTGIPFTLLVDQSGKIVAENLRGADLENKLEELLK